MNRYDVIRMAREAGWTNYDSQDERFELFAQAAYAAGAAAEREACARAVEDVEPSPNPIINMTNRLAAAAIRARGQA